MVTQSFLCLQTGNEDVQQAVHDYFVNTKDTRLFKSAHDVMVTCMESLKDFKKSLKSVKKGQQQKPELGWLAANTEKVR